jgi:hypothetical protein
LLRPAEGISEITMTLRKVLLPLFVDRVFYIIEILLGI